MKAVRFHEYGGPEVLHYEDVDRPRPAAGQVLVEVAATSFNPVEAGIRAGYLQQIFPIAVPHTPGIDVAGTVVELGDGVQGHAVGDRVLNLVNVGEAEMVALTGLVRPGGTIVSTVAPATGDAGRGVRGTGMELRADAGQLGALAKKVDAGELHVAD